MELEKQVCNLELAKKLKELGVMQESYLIWIRGYQEDSWSLTVSKFNHHVNRYAAFTVAELGEMLPIGLDSKGQAIQIERSKDGWVSGLRTYREFIKTFIEPREADARAKMLIYLLEQGKEVKG